MKINRLLIFFTLLTGQVACNRNSPSLNDIHEDNHSEEGIVQLSQEQETITGLSCGVFIKQPLNDLIKAPGFIDSPPQYKATINPYTTIFVEKVHFIVGDPVKKGEVVVTASSPEFVNLQQEYLETLNSLEMLEKDFERKQALQQDNVSSVKEFEKARSTYQMAKAKKSGLLSNLELMGANIPNLELGNIQPKIFIRSPISGKISSLQTSVGQHSSPHEILMEVNNVNHMHVEMKVLEQDITKVKEGQPVLFTLPDFKDQLFNGQVYRMANTIDQKSRFVLVHAHFNEENESFLPGMYINSHIVVNQDSVWSVPSSAIIHEGSETFLFVLQETNASGRVFQRKRVRTGTETMGFTAILNPIEEMLKDSVVVKGTYYLSNALNEAGGHDN